MTNQKVRMVDLASLAVQLSSIEGLKIYLLGGFRLVQGKATIGAEQFSLRKACDLVKLLALAPHHRLPREQVMEWLWPEGDPKASLNSLNQALRSARQVLHVFQPAVYLQNEAGLLDLVSDDALWVDVEAFEAAALQARRSQDPALYRSALALYGGELLPEDRYAEWTLQRREILSQAYVKLLLDLGNYHTTHNEFQPAIEAYQKLITCDPLIEEAYVGLMRCLALSGQRSQALHQYQLLQETLSHALDAEPDRETQMLHTQILEGKYPPPESRTTLGETLIQPFETPRHNLPLQLTSFIGREQDLAQVSDLLTRFRLVTLTGPGGVGKTRLGLEVAGRIKEQFPDGVWFIDLAPIIDQYLVLQTIATTIGLRDESDRPPMDVLTQFLSHRQAFLILDNCEHQLEVCARLVEGLLKNAPRLKILATSREVIGIAGETSFRVPSLKGPDPKQMSSPEELQGYESVRLFVDRARAVLPSFQLDESNAHLVAQICQRLDGIPLALELAATQLELLSADQLASRLDHAFRLLTRGSRTALPRQQTLRATIDWSFRLLSIHEQTLLRRLAVFSGGGTLEAIESVCAGDGLVTDELISLLSGLSSKSMVNVERVLNKEPHYRLLETVRQYALEKLIEADESQVFYDRHLFYFLELAEKIEPLLRTAVVFDQLQVLNQEMDNFRIALSWSLDEPGSCNVEVGIRLATALLNLWHTQSFHKEGYAWLTKGIPGLVGDSASMLKLRAQACFSLGHLIIPLGRYAEARQWLQESLEISENLGDPSGAVRARSLLAEVLAYEHSLDQAKELAEISLLQCRSLNDPWLVAWVLCRCGWCFQYRLEHDVSKPLFEESLALFEKIGDPLQVRDDYIPLGRIAQRQEDYSRSSYYFHQSLKLAQVMHSKYSMGHALAMLGENAFALKNYEQMRELLQESVSLNRETGSRFLFWSLLLLGIAELHLSQPVQAAQYFRELLSTTQDTWVISYSLAGIAKTALGIHDPSIIAQLLGSVQNFFETNHLLEDKNSYDRMYWNVFYQGWLEVQQQLDPSAFTQAFAKGASLRLEQAISLALSLPFENLP